MRTVKTLKGVVLMVALAAVASGCGSSGVVKHSSAKACAAHGGTYNAAAKTCTYGSADRCSGRPSPGAAPEH